MSGGVACWVAFVAASREEGRRFRNWTVLIRAGEAWLAHDPHPWRSTPESFHLWNRRRILQKSGAELCLDFGSDTRAAADVYVSHCTGTHRRECTTRAAIDSPSPGERHAIPRPSLDSGPVWTARTAHAGTEFWRTRWCTYLTFPRETVTLWTLADTQRVRAWRFGGRMTRSGMRPLS